MMASNRDSLRNDGDFGHLSDHSGGLRHQKVGLVVCPRFPRIRTRLHYPRRARCLTLFKTFFSAFVLPTGTSKLQLELNIDDFKPMKNDSNAPDQVAFYTELLSDAYEEQMKKSKDALHMLTRADVFTFHTSQCSRNINFLSQLRRSALFNKLCEASQIWGVKGTPFLTLQGVGAQLQGLREPT
jgi:hypothetical protein